ncbi:hypothetical protein CSA08_04830 [Candidatus Gracilibacteria bacterium]|nr:MAG: hypothetical protein CSA08_04830 [Candidatus Gracilibacteria bacterium]
MVGVILSSFFGIMLNQAETLNDVKQIFINILKYGTHILILMPFIDKYILREFLMIKRNKEYRLIQVLEDIQLDNMVKSNKKRRKPNLGMSYKFL